MKIWVHKSVTIVFMLEDLKKKQVISFVYSIDRFSDELSLTSAKKGFMFKELKEKARQDVHDPWDEFFEVFQIEKDELARDS